MKKIQVVDYIDRNEVIELLRREAQFLSEPPMERNEYEQLKLVHELEFKIKELSAADVVEVVRCKDCDVPHNKWTGCPYMNGLIPPPNHFCSYGERK